MTGRRVGVLVACSLLALVVVLVCCLLFYFVLFFEGGGGEIGRERSDISQV